MDKNEIIDIDEEQLPLKKQIAIFFTGFAYLGLTVISFLVSLIYSIGIQVATTNNPDLVLKPKFESIFINTGCYSLLFLIIITIANVDIKKLFNSFKNKESYLYGFACFTITLIFEMFYSQIVYWIKGPTGSNANEESIDSIIKLYPVMSIIIFGILGPICEEMTYRVGLFSMLKRKSKLLAYIATPLVFAIIHFTFNGDLLTEIINLPFYIFSGLAFSYVYDKTGFAGSLCAHITNNMISVCGELFFLIKK